MQNLRSFWHWIRRKLNLGLLLFFLHPKSFMVVEGWNHSFRLNRSINRAGEPIPWCVYSFTHFIEPRLSKEMRIFEYGCGNSTHYYAKRVREIIAVEHNPTWAAEIKTKLPTTGKVILRHNEQEYVAEIEHHGLFDIVIIDGICREYTVEHVLKALKPDGVIVWDNPELPDFPIGFARLQHYGFRELQFYGLGPINFVPAFTSILYRTENCLGI